MRYEKLLFILMLPLLASAAASAQTYTIQRQIIADGGGTMSSAEYTLDSTIGIPTAGDQQSVGNENAHVGFWFHEVAPTAAAVSISGRVVDALGRGIPGAFLVLTDTAGLKKTVLTGAFGYYRFDDVVSGQAFVLSISAKQRHFANPSIMLQTGDEIRDLDFIALP
ncbi:MAG: carboxypeptidase regulatory-like domain-containing protein [Acidobacteria bacterium]|nr:carboxypeptidase regulatory-like domain-containing protein [Acidobacteriota bacterium]